MQLFLKERERKVWSRGRNHWIFLSEPHPHCWVAVSQRHRRALEPVHSRQAHHHLAKNPTLKLPFSTTQDIYTYYVIDHDIGPNSKLLDWWNYNQRTFCLGAIFARSCFSRLKSFCSDQDTLSALWLLVSDVKDFIRMTVLRKWLMSWRHQHFREKLQKGDIKEIRVSGVQQQAWQTLS